MSESLQLSVNDGDEFHRRGALSRPGRLFKLAIVLIVIVATCLLAYMRIWDKVAIDYCEGSLNQIGLACCIYAGNHNGNFPDTFEQMFLTIGLNAHSVICPATNDNPAPGETAAEQIAHLHEGHHLSYIYVGKGLTTSVPNPSAVVLAYEPLTNHKKAGANFLFADGHVQWMEAKEAKALIAAIPVVRPTTAP